MKSKHPLLLSNAIGEGERSGCVCSYTEEAFNGALDNSKLPFSHKRYVFPSQKEEHKLDSDGHVICLVQPNYMGERQRQVERERKGHEDIQK